MLPEDDEGKKNRYRSDEASGDLAKAEGLHAQEGGYECYEYPQKRHVDDVRIVVGGSSHEIEVFGPDDVLHDPVFAQTVDVIGKG